MTSKTTDRPRARIDPARWHLLKDILADALEAPTENGRAALLAARCANDVALLAEAESLVREAHALAREETDPFEDCAEQATQTLWQEEVLGTSWRVGAYEVVRELGRGGMGAVYLGKRADGQFEKDVAIKVLKRGTDTDEVLRRFAAERHILARLDHPNIARLLDAGTTDDGLPYFVMEYVRGLPVTRFAREKNLSIEERLAVFLKICAAVEMAHHGHVIHRDLKPGNILVGAEGEPKLLDFGIAKILNPGAENAELTAPSEQRLTPICASPEQTDGRAVTEASDVYALGALLYELLSGQQPHQFSNKHPSREEIARVVREQEPMPPSARVLAPATAKRVRGDLDAIVLHALCKEPELRYARVADFAADIRRHLAGEPVLARRPTLRYRTRHLFHQKGARFVWGAIAVLLLAGAVWAIWDRTQRVAPETVSAAPPAASGTAPDTRKSIAILPFETVGDNNPPAYFADGVQDNILTDLGKVSGLKVISRSGVAGYRDKARNIKQIGRELGVATILEGSVQISGDRVRINAQLIDTKSDAQIWAEHYDREVKDIFALQSELAQTIAAQLKTKLTTGEQAQIWKQPTQDLVAYDLYLRARAALADSHGPEPSKMWSTAIDLLNDAIARDPQFTLAYCLLNEAHVYLYRYTEAHPATSLVAAKDAADTALRLAPDLEEARLALARYYYHGLSDYRRTEQELARISSSSPHQVEYFTLASLAARRLGQWADSIRDGEKAVELDPQNGELAVNLIQTYSGLRMLADSARVADAAIARARGTAPVRLWVVKSEIALAMGDLEAAKQALESIPNKGGMERLSSRMWLGILQKDTEVVKSIGAQADPEWKGTPTLWLMLAMNGLASGDEAEVRRCATEARVRAEAGLALRPDAPEMLGSLALAEAYLGHKEESVRLARRAVELRPTKVDALNGPMAEMQLVEVLAVIGDRDGALQAMARLVKIPFGLNYGNLKYDPAWDGLRDDPRFAAVLEEARHPLLID